MDPDFTPLDGLLDTSGGYLLDAPGSDSNQRYLSGFDAPDPYVTLYADGEVSLLVSSLEYGRAKSASRATHVARFADYDYHRTVEKHGAQEAMARTVAAFLADHGVDSAVVPRRFPISTADGLREQGVSIAVEPEDVVGAIRAVKTPTELDYVRRTQRANEAAMATAEALLRESTVRDGVLSVDDEPLTSERVKREIEIALLRRGCSLDDTIVACGRDAADPHDRGSGPLRPDEAIIVDIFPRDKETKYHADMTRTFAVGDPGDTLREWFDLTDAARRAALDAVEPGATGAAVHAAACEVYEAAGLPTLRSTPTTETGFIHSTGHGVGLDVHELPKVSPDGGELEPGHVITIEPGLYDPAVGGVRIEDLVVVTEDGHENLTEYPVSFVID